VKYVILIHANPDPWGHPSSRYTPEGGLPDNPRGWLIRVASRRLVDQRRSEQARADRELLVALHTPPDEALLAPAADTPTAPRVTTPWRCCCCAAIRR